MIASFLRELLKFFLLYFVRPILIVATAVLSPIYRLVFRRLDDRVHKKQVVKFEEEIFDQLPWLFRQRGGAFVSGARDLPQVFDYVGVTVRTEAVLLSFIRGRDEFRVDVAPAHAPNDWQEVSSVIADITGADRPPQYYRLADFSRLLASHFDQVQAALSEENYGEPRRDLRTIRLTKL